MANHRVILKLSGEALSSGGSYDEARIRDIAAQVRSASEEGVEIGIVIGGGNYWRGRSSKDIDRTKADQIGMLATVMNCIYVSEIFRSCGMKTAVLTPFVCGSFTELFSKDLANEYFAQGKILFLAGGTGHPYFSTDTGIMLRAVELDADIVLLAKSVDGIYDADPSADPGARKFDTISLAEIYDRRLEVIDLTATALCMQVKMPFAVFDLREEGSVAAALRGDIHGTVVTVS